MRLRSLSATAGNCYEKCPARYRTEHFDRAPTISGVAANLGTACHMVSQLWVSNDHHLAPAVDEDTLKRYWDQSYWGMFQTGDKYDEGWKLVLKWAHRQNWSGRTVVSIEQKKFFMLNTSIGQVPFNYIMDRLDLHHDGDVEVVDYKTISMPVQPVDLKDRIQSRAYALAAHIEFPQARRIWVTFDLYRYDPVGIVFTADECEETRQYLEALAERIIADEDPAELLNDECRWCARRQVCETLQARIAAAGDEIVETDLGTIAQRRYEASVARKALDSELNELDELILTQMVNSGAEEEQVGGYRVTIRGSRRRVVDNQALARLLPPDVFGRLATVGPSAVDELLKGGEIDEETASRVRQTMRWTQGARTVHVRRATE